MLTVCDLMLPVRELKLPATLMLTVCDLMLPGLI